MPLSVWLAERRWCRFAEDTCISVVYLNLCYMCQISFVCSCCSCQDVCIHECTSRFLKGLLVKYLNHFQWHHMTHDSTECTAELNPDTKMLFLSPYLLGWPAVRERSYLVACLNVFIFVPACLFGSLGLGQTFFNNAIWCEVGTNVHTCGLKGRGLNIIHELFERPTMDCSHFLVAPEANGVTCVQKKHKITLASTCVVYTCYTFVLQEDVEKERKRVAGKLYKPSKSPFSDLLRGALFIKHYHVFVVYAF